MKQHLVILYTKQTKLLYEYSLRSVWNIGIISSNKSNVAFVWHEGNPLPPAIVIIFRYINKNIVGRTPNDKSVNRKKGPRKTKSSSWKTLLESELIENRWAR